MNINPGQFLTYKPLFPVLTNQATSVLLLSLQAFGQVEQRNSGCHFHGDLLINEFKQLWVLSVLCGEM